MTKKRAYHTASKKAKIAITAIEGKLTQAQITSEYGVHATQVKTWKQSAIEAINDLFSGANEKQAKSHEALVEALYQEIGRLQAQLSWLKKKHDI
jgi:transposase-like protein